MKINQSLCFGLFQQLNHVIIIIIIISGETICVSPMFSYCRFEPTITDVIGDEMSNLLPTLPLSYSFVIYTYTEPVK